MTMQLEHMFSLLFCLHLCVGKRYDKYKLYRGTPVNSEHLDFFKNISEIYDVNFWKDPGSIYMPIDFTIHPKDVDAFVRDADAKGIYVTTILSDVQKAFDNQKISSYVRRKMDTFNWQSYYRLKDIYGWLKDLQAQYPDEVSVFTIGLTAMKRRILGLKLLLNGSVIRSKVIVEGGIHAREWISSAFVTYLINELLHARSSNNTKLEQIALSYEWYFVPMVNPDGYEYTHTKDRLWRKNLRNGYGIDLNRNFDAAFGSVGVSKSTNSESYCGRFPFSEPESEAMRKFIQSHSSNLEYYIAFHSYGQLFIIPFAYTTKHVDNFSEMKQIGEQVAAKISRRYGTKYLIGNAYDTVGYKASGTSTCWVKDAFRVPYVATLELRDQGDFGFALPPEYILPTCRETMDGIIEMFEPKTEKLMKLPPRPPIMVKGQSKRILDALVIVSNIILVIVFK